LQRSAESKIIVNTKMSPLIDQLGTIINKTTALVDLCLVLQEENDLLKTENVQLKKQYEISKNKNSELEEMVKTIKFARSLEGFPIGELGLDEKTLDIKQKISKFVNEIDKCIVLLKKQY